MNKCRKAAFLAALCLFVGILVGCGQKALTIPDAKARCYDSVPDCCDPGDGATICDAFAEAMEAGYNGVKDCRQACESVRRKFMLNPDMGSCVNVFQAGQDSCNEYCNQQYYEPQPTYPIGVAY